MTPLMTCEPGIRRGIIAPETPGAVIQVFISLLEDDRTRCVAAVSAEIAGQPKAGAAATQN